MRSRGSPGDSLDDIIKFFFLHEILHAKFMFKKKKKINQLAKTWGLGIDIMTKIRIGLSPNFDHNFNPRTPCFVLLNFFFYEIFYMQNLCKKNN